MKITFNPHEPREIYHALETVKKTILDLCDNYQEYEFDITFKYQHKNMEGYEKDNKTLLYVWSEWRNVGEIS